MTGAALAIVALAASAAPASGGFRYVPPAETEAVAELANKGSGEAEAVPGTRVAPGADALQEDIEPPPAPGREVSGRRVWRVHAGERLRQVLARWGARADLEVLFLTDRGWRLDAAAAFEGGFTDAVQALFRGLSHLPHAPAAAPSEGGTTLVVTHRLPASAQGGGKP